MPNHWESSARPLFVRTVFVNGNRHAVLFEEDPHLRYGNSPVKKISRSNSSLSFGSDLSITSSESQDSVSEERVLQVRQQQQQQQQRKDLSSELQSCLIKLQLASGNLGSRSDDDKCNCQPKEEGRSGQENSNSRRHKWKRDKTCRKKHCEHPHDGLANKQTGQINNGDSSCYFYNFESTKRKKNYCVVKITSQPHHFTVSCNCNGDCIKPNCKNLLTGKNNMLISATIHNLLMSGRKDTPANDAHFFLNQNPEPIDLYWNTYMARSYYNSLSERVFQWLDLTSKRKNQAKKINSTPEEVSSNNIERIFSGKTFTGENVKTECLKCDNKQRNKAKKRETTKTELFHEVETEVVGEKTVLSKETARYNPRDYFREVLPTERHKSESNWITSPSEIITKSSSVQQLATPIKSPVKVQDLLLDYNLRRNFDIPLGRRTKRKIRESRDFLTFQNKHRAVGDVDSTEEEGEENVITPPLHHWGKRVIKRSQKCTSCHCEGTRDGYGDKIKNQHSTEGYSEKNQNSINNLNFTRGRPVLIQNLLSSQQQEEMSGLRTEKIIWGSEKDTGRPQLHIFMPSLLLRDASDDSMSECENVLNLC